MTSEQFAYWLQGFTELSPDMERPTAEQWLVIKQHLATVFVKVTPAFPARKDAPVIYPSLNEMMRQTQWPLTTITC